MSTALTHQQIFDHIHRPGVGSIYWRNGEMRREPVFICSELGDYAMQNSKIHNNVTICYNPIVKNHFKDLDEEVDRIYRRQLAKKIYDLHNQDGCILFDRFIENGIKSEEIIPLLGHFRIKLAMVPTIILQRVE